jgi:hypothetical protein
MAIHRPSVSVEEAKRLARNRSADLSGQNAAALPPEAPALAAAEPVVVGPARQTPSPLVGDPSPDPSAAPIEPAGASGDGPAAKAKREPAARASSVRTAAVEPLSGLVFPEAEPSEPKIQVFLSAPLPAKGVSASFDVLGRQYPRTRALQMILRRALDNYEIRLEDGSYKSAPGGYPVDGPDKPAIIQTSRMLPVRLVETARAHFDPLGFESTRAFGRKLACAALASFFEAEKAASRPSRSVVSRRGKGQGGHSAMSSPE